MEVSRTTQALTFNTGVSSAEWASGVVGQTPGQTQQALLPGSTTVTAALDEVFPEARTASADVLAALVAGNGPAMRTPSGFNAAARWDGKFGFQPIPSFEEYCAWASEQTLFTNIEIKTDNTFYPNIEQEVWDMICKYGLPDRVMFSSFNHVTLLKLREIAPNVDVGALVLEDGMVRVRPGDYCRASGFQAWHPSFASLNDENVANCKAAGIAINVWTVNDMAALEQLRVWDCEGVITNFPGVAKAYIAALDA